MSIKLVVMKSGEQIIADIQEMVVENKAVGYYLNKPCSIQMINRDKEEVLINGTKSAFDVSLFLFLWIGQ